MKKFIFIDESGDPGVLGKTGSSKFFVITFVIFSDFLEAEKAGIEIKQVRRDRFKNDEQEFHFTKDSNSTRKIFFDELKSFDYSVKTFVVDKSKIDTSIFRNNERFYEFFLLKAFYEFSQYFDNSNIYIDGQGSRIYKRKITSTIREVFRNQKIKLREVSFENSKANTLIQLADMYAGLIKRNFDNPNKDIEEIYKSVSKKIEVILYQNK